MNFHSHPGAIPGKPQINKSPAMSRHAIAGTLRNGKACSGGLYRTKTAQDNRLGTTESEPASHLLFSFGCPYSAGPDDAQAEANLERALALVKEGGKDGL